MNTSMLATAATERLQLGAEEIDFAASIPEAMPGMFYLYDESGQFLRWNRNFERVSGYDARELSNIHPLDFFAGEDRERVARAIEQAFTRGEATVEASFISKDRTTTPYFFTGKRITFGGAPCVIGLGVDISERTRAQEALRKSEERYRTTLDCTLEGCQILGHDWRYLYLNDAASTHNRRPSSELLGRRMQDMWPGIEGSEVFAMMRHCMEQRSARHGEIEFVFPDGQSGWFDVRCQPVPEGIFVLSIDISERKRAEFALREVMEHLEQKVIERTADLEAARERAEVADRTKSAFLATMSHELRTPLNSIIGFTGIVLSGMAGNLSEEQSKQLGMVRTSARHLLALINDVLDISKVEAGQFAVHFEPFDLRASIERVLTTAKPLAAKKGLQLSAEVAPELTSIVSDRRRVDQILLNLVNNAIKFTEHGGVRVCARLLDQPASDDAPGPSVSIAVQDTGMGVKEDELPTLFQPFRQLDTGIARQFEGTGLGLAICRRLCSLLHGSVCAQSVWGEGSVFTLTLPLQPMRRPA